MSHFTFHNQQFLNDFADELYKKYPGSEVEVDFARIEKTECGTSVLLENEHYQTELCQDPVYDNEYEFEVKLEETTQGCSKEASERIEQELRKKFEIGGTNICCSNNCGQVHCVEQWEELEEDPDEGLEQDSEVLNSILYAFR